MLLNYFQCGYESKSLTKQLLHVWVCSVVAQLHLIAGSIHCNWCSGSRGYLQNFVCHTLLKVFQYSHGYSNSLASPKLVETRSAAYTFRANHAFSHLNYRQLINTCCHTPRKRFILGMKLSSRDIISCNALWRQVLLQHKGWDRGRWVSAPKGCRQHGHLLAQIKEYLDCCPPMNKRVEKTFLSHCMVPISTWEAFSPVQASGCWLSTVTIASSLMGGCGLSHEHVEYGCKSTCVKFRDRNLGIWQV